MKLDRDGEIGELLAQVAALRHPKMDYSKMSPPDLAVIHFIHRIFEIQASYIALLRSFTVMYQKFKLIPEPIARCGELPFEELVKWSRNYTRQHLLEVYTVYPHQGLIRLLIDLRIEGAFLELEFERRMEQHRVGGEILLLEDGQDRLLEFQKLLSVDKIGSFDLREQSANDIKQSAIETAWSAWNELKNQYAGDPYEPPEFPFDMIAPEEEFWREMMIKRVWSNGKQAHMREMVPLLTGQTEAIPGIVHGQLRETWRKIKRRKQIMEGRPRDLLDPEQNERIDWSIIPEKSRAEVFQRLKDELHQENSEFDTAAAKVDSERAYRAAIKRWGKRGRLFLDALRRGEDVVTASVAAGISRQTGHKYLKELQKLLAEKKPSE
jgi:hypothetical protein